MVDVFRIVPIEVKVAGETMTQSGRTLERRGKQSTKSDGRFTHQISPANKVMIVALRTSSTFRNSSGS